MTYENPLPYTYQRHGNPEFPPGRFGLPSNFELGVFVLRRTGQDATNGGVTSTHSMVTLVSLDLADTEEKRSKLLAKYGPRRGVTGPIKAKPILVVLPGRVGNAPPIAVPIELIDQRAVESGVARGMSGGNYITTTDSRFSRAYGIPLSVHDRVETREQQRLYSL